MRTDIISSNFFEGGRKDSASLLKVIRYVRISKVMRQNPDIYELLMWLAKTVYSKTDWSNSIVPTHLEIPLLFQMDLTQCSFCLQDADRNLKNKKVKGAVEPKQFLKEASSMYRARGKVYRKRSMTKVVR